jgi:probable phosphoglycerate mutase
MPTRFIIIRHGETHWNRAGRFQGHLDSALTEDGVQQARALAERLAAESIDQLYSSDLGRAYHTARLIAEKCKLRIVTDARLREKHLGMFQGLTAAEMKTRFPDEYVRYVSHEADFVIPDGESLRQFHDRAIACFADLAARSNGGTVAVVTHGGLLACLYRHVAGVALDTPRDFPLQNASFNAFTHEDGTWTRETWGDVSHLKDADALDEL